MLSVIGLKLRSLDVDFQQLSWEIEDTHEDVLDYTFQILRGESSNGPFEAVAEPFVDRYVFFDRITYPWHPGRSVHYVVRVKNIVTEDIVDFGPVNMQPDPDLIARELRRHMNLLFREFTGRRCWIVPVRTFGQRCTCWNSVLSKRTRSGCPLCYDTGFVRGYNYPIETFIQIEPGSNQTEQNMNTGPTYQMNTTARVSNIGIVKPRDLVIEPENRRWRVTQINQTEQVRAPVHLELTLHEIPKSDVEYAIELKMDTALKDLVLSPSRNFTNPHNFENFENEEIPSIFGLYPSTYYNPNK
jgi:hypothetical protein